MSTQIEFEMVVGCFVIPNIFPLKGVHPPVLRPRQPQWEQKGVSVGDGGDAWVLEVILQVVYSSDSQGGN